MLFLRDIHVFVKFEFDLKEEYKLKYGIEWNQHAKSWYVESSNIVNNELFIYNPMITHSCGEHEVNGRCIVCDYDKKWPKLVFYQE